jgi:hypothetical protein
MNHPENTPKRPSFLISKWYMDCVADDGTAFIGYNARLQWRSLSLDYSSTLRQSGNEPAAVQTTIAGSTFPVENDGTISWRSDRLKTSGRWTARSEPIEQTILECDAGAIQWRCVAPLADATVSFDGGETLSGLGYCEHISISIPPWQMPIDELRWGRFLTQNSYVVWIDLKGSAPVTMVFRNGVRDDNSIVADDQIQLDGDTRTLKFDESRTLRTGSIVATALSSVPLLGSLLSSNGLMIDETKWCSRGVVSGNNLPEQTGWAIHEVVRWVR